MPHMYAEAPSVRIRLWASMDARKALLSFNIDFQHVL